MFIKVKVTPGSKKEEVKRVSKDSFAISVCEKAKDGMANRHVTVLLAREFGNARVRLVSGHHRHAKIFDVEGGKSN